MSSVSYDLDTSGGLMPLIRALIKPPDEDASTQKPKKPQHPYYKRPGKGHNHDSCDACGEGGDLICCDRCPASFHLGCYDPPLDENDIPAGLWLCRECRASDDAKPPSARGSRAQSPVDDKKRSLRNNRSNSSKKKSKDDEEEAEKEKEPETLSPMEALVKAARVLNPRQFELPNEMKVPCLFPGTEKEVTKGSGSSNSEVALPAKSCHACLLSCRTAPLLQCDYCPLLYHQDCLDPPLTALPTGRWMCPNHVEQYIDWKMVNSVSATERVALWDKFTGPVDQHAIKIDFIRRARANRPRFRVKIPVGVKGRVIVPDMVRYHYGRPPPLMPSRREHVRCRNVLNRLRQDPEFDAASEEDPLAPKHIVCLNTSCPQYRGAGPCPHAAEAEAEAEAGADADEDLKAIAEEQEDENHSQSSSSSDSDIEYVRSAKRRRAASPPSARVRLRGGAGARRLLRLAHRQLRRLDRGLLTLLAWQQLQQVSWGEQVVGAWARAGVSRAVAAAVARSVAGHRLAARGEALPSALLSAADRRRIAAAVWGEPPVDSPPSPPPVLPTLDAYVRATLSAVEAPALCIPMRRSSLTIGTDSGCTLRLSYACRHAAPRHATIFYDEVTGHFELINYSEWGTAVNGVLYACDVSPRASAPEDAVRLPAPRPTPPKPPKINGDLTCPSQDEGPCRCADANPGAPGAWEGSAIVPHGALIAFGCLHYVFSIADSLQTTREYAMQHV